MLKLGGSLITDKTAIEIVRDQNLEMLSRQLAEAINEDGSLKGLYLVDIFIPINMQETFKQNILTSSKKENS